MIVPVVRGAVCTVVGFTLGVVMKDAANKEIEASIVVRNTFFNDIKVYISLNNVKSRVLIEY